MDCTNPIFNLDVKEELDLISEIEEITRNLTFDLHKCRAVNIKDYRLGKFHVGYILVY
jgi:hypothetical protein